MTPKLPIPLMLPALLGFAVLLPGFAGSVSIHAQSAAPQTVPAGADGVDSRLPPGDKIIAYVGPDVILMGDVLPEVDHFIRKALSKTRQTVSEAELETIRQNLIRKRLNALIETRRVLVLIRQKVPEEHYQSIRENFSKAFDKRQIKDWVKKFNLGSREELVRKSSVLFGVPFAEVRDDFVDQALASNWVRQNKGASREVSHAEILLYYRQHEKEYAFKSKALWEEIQIEYGAKRSRKQAWRKIAELGNRLLSGASFAEIAGRESDGATASEGGVRDWTDQGALVSQKLDQAIFSLPVGTLSPIIEDRDALHIIRVRERRPAGKTSFAEAQAKIKTQLKKGRAAQKQKEYLSKVRQQVPVRNLFEESLTAKRQTPEGGLRR